MAEYFSIGREYTYVYIRAYSEGCVTFAYKLMSTY